MGFVTVFLNFSKDHEGVDCGDGGGMWVMFSKTELEKLSGPGTFSEWPKVCVYVYTMTRSLKAIKHASRK